MTRKEYMKEYTAKNLDKLQKYRREYREKNKARLTEYRKNWYLNNKDKARKRTEVFRMKQYGITIEIYNQMLANQNGKCAICLTETPGGKGKFNVDHCHISGKVRGLLCHYCNLGLGNFKDNVTILNNAIDYLKS